ncbi:putative transcription factor C2H2 family [Lupinus albus]|uniref:Putative transcription factor C2H2 family n=1 Tax=Lupinus albus TaxID=3870 RepID=A0A6A4QXL9_LUPAL|nr:putative transcription factor C2H2 family [Lupinus albus]
MVKEPRYKAKVSPPLTCLLCNEFFKKATTVKECMHTFCKECIEKKIIDDNIKHCPVCNVDLGCSPLEKLREDRKLQHLREKIFPKKGKNAKANKIHNHSGGKKESESAKLKGSQRKKEGTVKFTRDLNLPPPPPMFGSGSESSHKFGNIPSQHEIGSSSESNKVWLSLVASEDREVGARLPQISNPFIRVDGSLAVSYIEKYVIKKLGLPNNTEVEMQLWGQPVPSSCKLQNLLEMWLQTMPKNEKIHTSVGSSAEDFVMVLSYGLKG